MAWLVEDRRRAAEVVGGPYLTAELKDYLSSIYFPRYPTKRAVLLPALHAVQHEYGYIPPSAIDELAVFLGISSGEVLDTATFYEEYWLRPKGKYLLGVCRSLACEICGSGKITDHLKRKLNVEAGETTPDGRFTLIELECLGSCGTAPAILCNDVLHEDLTIQQTDALLASLPEDPADYKDPTVNWKEEHGFHAHAALHTRETHGAGPDAIAAPEHPTAAGPGTAAMAVPSDVQATTIIAPAINPTGSADFPASSGPVTGNGECDDHGPDRVLQPPK